MSSDSVITIENLSKKYTIRHRNGLHHHDGLRHLLQHATLGPWRWLRKTRNGSPSSTREEFWALRDVDVEIKQGEVVGIIGRNGAGKSTLLKILSRITEPTSGRITIKGRVASLLEVGTGFHPELTGRENIFLNGAILGMSRQEIRRKFDEIVAFAEIEKFLDTPVKRYSSGMYVRLAFAVAAHLEPDILVIDEVLAVGDAAFQHKCVGKMGEVAGDGRTILLVSHNMRPIEALCKEVYCLHDGSVLCHGHPREAIKRYLGAFANGLVVHVTTPWLRWGGLLNRGMLDDLSPNDDVNLRLGFATVSRPIDSFQVDINIQNERGETVIHAKSKYVTPPARVPADSNVEVLYRIESPRLAPGPYVMTVYACEGNHELFWAENIDAFTVSAKPYFGIVSCHDELKSSMLPVYSAKYSS